MSIIRVDIIGMSLWVRRRDHWEVFFPAKTSANDQHEPYLTITGSASSDRNLELVSGATMHFTGVNLPSTSTERPDWMLPLHHGLGSALKLPTPAYHPNVVSTMLLPFAALRAVGGYDAGPVAFNGKNDFRLGYGTTAELEVSGEPVLQVSPKGSTAGGVPHRLIATATNQVHVVINNLTHRDQDPECESTKHGEHLYETDDLLALCDMRVAVPRYFGPDLKAVCARTAGLSSLAPLLSPTRLCPQGFCDDCD